MKEFEVIFKQTEYLKTTVKAKDRYIAEEEAYEEYDNGNCWATRCNIEIATVREV